MLSRAFSFRDQLVADAGDEAVVRRTFDTVMLPLQPRAVMLLSVFREFDDRRWQAADIYTRTPGNHTETSGEQ